MGEELSKAMYEAAGIEAYNAYGKTVNWKAYNGEPMATWDNLRDNQKVAWAEAAWAGHTTYHRNRTRSNGYPPEHVTTSEEQIVVLHLLLHIAGKLRSWKERTRTEISRRAAVTLTLLEPDIAFFEVYVLNEQYKDEYPLLDQ